MKNPFKKFKDWNKQRIERNYERVISTYSSEEQKLIRKGRGVELTGKSLKQLIEENPDKEIIPLTGPGTIYKFNVPFTNEKIPVGGRLKNSFVSYSTSTIGCRDYYGDVKDWLNIGKIGADVLCNYTARPINLSDAGALTIIILGIPAKIQDKKLIKNL